MSLSIPPYGDREAIEHARRWLAHVEAGRIGSRPEPDPERLLRHRRNEEIVRGFAR